MHHHAPEAVYLVGIGKEVVEFILVDSVQWGFLHDYSHSLEEVIDMTEKLDIFFIGVSQQVEVSIIHKFTCSYKKKISDLFNYMYVILLSTHLPWSVFGLWSKSPQSGGLCHESFSDSW